jgi:antitoxin CptB
VKLNGFQWSTRAVMRFIRRGMTETLENRRKKLRIRAWRRGFKEADLILGRFADKRLDKLGEAEALEFETLLEQADQDIYDWIIGRCVTPIEFDGPVMTALKAFRIDQFAASGDGPTS